VASLLTSGTTGHVAPPLSNAFLPTVAPEKEDRSRAIRTRRKNLHNPYKAQQDDAPGKIYRNLHTQHNKQVHLKTT
jgi:hypothetical protein